MANTGTAANKRIVKLDPPVDPDPGDFAAAKIAIFLASLTAGTLGVLILLPRVRSEPVDA